MKFDLIVIDPPFSFSDKLSMSDVPRGADANYSTLSNLDILNLDIKSLASDDGAILALWVPSALLGFGLQLMEAYGFNQKQTYIWVKNKKSPLKKLFSDIKKIKHDKLFIKNIKKVFEEYDISNTLSMYLGRLFRQTHEICLIGTSNNGIYKKLKNKSQRSVSFGFNDKHSKKPEHLQDSLDLMFPDQSIKRLEVFARRQRPGYMCVGNENEMSLDEDIRVSIDKLKNLSDADYNILLPLTNGQQNKTLANFWSNL